MPHIIYNSILLSPISEFRLTYEPVADDTQLDPLYDAVHVSGVFEVNGQVELRELDEPPVSMVDTGELSDRPAEAIRNRPPGMAAPLPPNDRPKDTDGAGRQVGAAPDEDAFNTFPYSGVIPSPSFTAERMKAPKLVAAAVQPSVTWRNITEKLTQPRGQLFVFENGGAPDDVLVHSPGFANPCDSKGGPTPTLLDLTQSQGDGVTYFVSWHCVTYVPKKRRTDGGDPLLSNRWTMTHLIRNGGFTDVAVEGVAIFDLGILHRIGFNPDFLRPQLMLPIAFGYERKDQEIVVSEDMTTVHYKYVDRQREVHFPAGVYAHVTELQAEHEQYIICDTDILGSLISTTDSALNRRWLAKAVEEPAAAKRPPKDMHPGPGRRS